MQQVRLLIAIICLGVSSSVFALELAADSPVEVRASFSCYFSQNVMDSQESVISFRAVLGIDGKMRRSIDAGAKGFAAYLPAQAVDSIIMNNPAIAQCERNGLV